MENKDLISIIIPVYNRPKLVAECLDSILAQTNPNWECIVVDDISTDNTWEVLENYVAKDQRIRIFKREREPKGAPTCRNIGIKYVVGNLLMFFDSDDILFKGALKSRVEGFEKNKDAELCISKGIIGAYPIVNNNYRIIATQIDNVNVCDFLNLRPNFVTNTVIYKTNFVVSQKLLWDENLSSLQDVDFHLNVIKKMNSYISLDERPDTLWRIHEGENVGSNVGMNIETIRSKLMILEKNVNQIRCCKHNKMLADCLSAYIFCNLSNELAAKVLMFYIKQYSKSCFVVFCYKVYRFVILKRIRIMPHIMKLWFILLGENKFLKGGVSNNNFATKQYDVNEL